MQRVDANLVLVAKHYNVSILSPFWLHEHGIVHESEFGRNQVFTEEVCQIQTDLFQLVAMPNRLQLTPNIDHVNDGNMISTRITNFVKALPHTPYTALGFNFLFYQLPVDDVPKLTRKFFIHETNSLYKQFDTEDAHFGAYFSRDYKNLRMKLDVKPITAVRDGVRQSGLQYGYNFNRDIQTDDIVDEVQKTVVLWSECLQIAHEIAEESYNG